MQWVQTVGRKKTATAIAHCKPGTGLVKLNGNPLELVKPEILRQKITEPLNIIPDQYFSDLNIRVRVKGGGHVSRVYAVRQAIAKAILLYHQKYVDEESKRKIRDKMLLMGRSILVAEPRRCEPKKFGGRGARARFQKSYR